MSDVPKELKHSPEDHKTEPLSDAQRNRIRSAVRGSDAPAGNAERQEKDGETSASEARESKQEAETLEDLSSKQVRDDIQRLRAEHPEKAATFEALDEHFPGMDLKKKEVLEAGTEIPDLEVVDEPTVVYRYHDGINSSGKWVSPEYIPDISERQERLSLPTAGVLADRYELQSGCRILKSFAAAKYGHKGGGEQYFVLDPDKMKRV